MRQSCRWSPLSNLPSIDSLAQRTRKSKVGLLETLTYAPNRETNRSRGRLWTSKSRAVFDQPDVRWHLGCCSRSQMLLVRLSKRPVARWVGRFQRRKNEGTKTTSAVWAASESRLPPFQIGFLRVSLQESLAVAAVSQINSLLGPP